MFYTTVHNMLLWVLLLNVTSESLGAAWEFQGCACLSQGDQGGR